jgi:hypothetical protein
MTDDVAATVDDALQAEGIELAGRSATRGGVC